MTRTNPIAAPASLVEGLLAFHALCGPVHKDARADRYKYATLGNVLDTVRQPLQSSGLVLTQTFDGDVLVTTLHHTSGEALSSRMTLPPVEGRGLNVAQALGSSISYARRYAILSILCLTAEDDDGASSGPPRTTIDEVVSLQKSLGLSSDTVKGLIQGLGAETFAALPAHNHPVLLRKMREAAGAHT